MLKDTIRRGALATALLALACAATAEGEHHWSYHKDQTGPKHWAEMEQDFAACGKGHEQSPIDIRTKAAAKEHLPAIQFDYQAVPLSIVNNGHSIQVNYAPGSFITVDGHRYELQQFHFHKPSEEMIDGKHAAMVAHLVHKDDQGKLAVVAVLLDPGEVNPMVATLWKNLPKKGAEATVQGVQVNAADLLPADRSYFTFAGSLTTPPCSEGVTWFVLKKPATLSKGEIARFGQAYPMNARPVQPLDGRVVHASD